MSTPTSKKSAFWHHVRLIGLQLLVGLGLGVMVWEIIGRWILELKYGSLGSSVTCSADVSRALAEFDAGLRTSAVVGAFGLVALALLVRFLLWRRRKRAKVASGKTEAEAATATAKVADSPKPPAEE